MWEAIHKADLEELEAYVPRVYNTTMQYILMQPILDLCEGVVQWMGTRVSKMWWKQEEFDLVRVCVEAAAALEGGA